MRENGERVDFFQNTAIALLAVLAVFLFSRTEAFRLGWQSAMGRFLSFQESTIPVSVVREPYRLSAPVRLAVRGRGARRGALFLTTDDEAFRPYGALLAAALRGVEPDAEDGGAEGAGRAGFFRALEGAGLYCDFLNPLPLAVLAGLSDPEAEPEGRTGAEAADLTARALLLVRDGEGTALYLWDGGSGYTRRAAPVSRAELEAALNRAAPEGVSFAVDHDAVLENGFRGVTPLSLFPDRTPRFPVLAAVSGLDGYAFSEGGVYRLLTVLRFNPLTNYRYTESNGTQVIVENGRSVRVRANGSVYYQSGGQTDVRLEGAGVVPTAWEAASGCAALLNAVLPAAPDGAALYLREAVTDGEEAILRFDYRMGGAPIRFADGSCAAEVTLRGGVVSALELRPRQYAATETDSLLLPLAQALGVAGLAPGAELSIGYCDTGGTRVNAQWLAG